MIPPVEFKRILRQNVVTRLGLLKNYKITKIHTLGVVKTDKKAQEIKADLLDQLERNGAIGKYYLDLVDKYMNLWETDRLLQKYIQENGVYVTYQNGKDQWGTRKNDSIDQQLKVNQQMIKILDYLGIKPPKDGGNDGKDEEL